MSWSDKNAILLTFAAQLSKITGVCRDDLQCQSRAFSYRRRCGGSRTRSRFSGVSGGIGSGNEGGKRNEEAFNEATASYFPKH